MRVLRIFRILILIDTEPRVGSLFLLFHLSEDLWGDNFNDSISLIVEVFYEWPKLKCVGIYFVFILGGNLFELVYFVLPWWENGT